MPQKVKDQPQPCYLLDGVRAKPWGSTGEVCIATGHSAPASKEEKETLVSSTTDKQEGKNIRTKKS